MEYPAVLDYLAIINLSGPHIYLWIVSVILVYMGWFIQDTKWQSLLYVLSGGCFIWGLIVVV